MGDDPVIPSLDIGSGNATHVTQHITNNHSISLTQLVLLVVMSAFGLALSIGALVITVMARQETNSLIEASERRAVDKASLAEREARIAQDTVTQMTIALGKKGIDFRTDRH